MLLFEEFKMEKIIKICIVLSIITFGSSSVFATGYCPTPTEFQAKNNSFMQRLNSSSSSYEQLTKIRNEQEAWMNSLYPGCLQYFKTTTNPQCSKLQSLTTSYMMLPSAKQPLARLEILTTTAKLKKICPADYGTIEYLVK